MQFQVANIRQCHRESRLQFGIVARQGALIRLTLYGRSLKKARTVTRLAGDEASVATSSKTGLLQQKVPKDQEASKEWDWCRSTNSLVAYSTLGLVLALGQGLGENPQKWTGLLYFGCLATISIYIGAHRALTAKNRNYLKFNVTFLAPVYLSCTLFGAYLLLVYFPNLSLRQVLDAYIYFVITTAVTVNLSGPIMTILNAINEKLPQGSKASILLPAAERVLDEDDLKDGPPEVLHVLLAGVLGLVVAQTDAGYGHVQFTINNLAAVNVAMLLIEGIGVRSVKVASLLLVGLLCYDVFWVFGSPSVVGANVMTTVATSDQFNGPFKFIFPRPTAAPGPLQSYPFSVLGLGDVVLPGLLVALTLRMDAVKHVTGSLISSNLERSDTVPQARLPFANLLAKLNLPVKYKTSQGDMQSRPRGIDPLLTKDEAGIMAKRRYFSGSLGGYLVGYAFTVVAVQQMGLAQPALLYLVPGVLAAVVARGVQQQELESVWAFEDKRKDMEDVAREKAEALQVREGKQGGP